MRLKGDSAVPYSNLTIANKTIGLKQTIKAIDMNEVEKVLLARDAEEIIKKKIIEKCKQKSIPLVWVDSMKHLGKASGIEVGAATVALLK